MADTAPPTLVSSNPAAFSINASRTVLTFTFSEAIARGAGNILITDGHSQTVFSGGSLVSRIVGASDTRTLGSSDSQAVINGSTLTITLNTPLALNHNYRVVFNKGAVTDIAGNQYNGLPDSTRLAFTTNSVVPDTIAPTAQAARFDNGGIYKAGGEVFIKVTFSENVIVNGTPRIALETGATDIDAIYHSGSGSNVLTFKYTVAPGNTTSALALRAIDGLYGSGMAGMITDVAGNALDQAHIVFNSLQFGGSYGSSVIVVDTTAPSTPGAPVLSVASDTGASTSDRITSDATPTFTGSGAEPNGLVILQLANRTEVGRAFADNAGNWTITSSLLSDGAKALFVQTYDDAGNASLESTNVNIEIDTAQPVTPAAPVLLSSDNSGVTSDAITNVINPRLTGTGATANMELRVYKGSSLDDAILVGSTTTDADGAWTMATISHLGIGTHAVFAVMVDAAGNISGLSPSYSITVSQAAPATPADPILASASDTGTSNTDRITSDTTPTFSGTVAAGLTVKLYDADDLLLGSAVADGDGKWEITPTLPAGTKAVHTIVTDAAGNSSQASPATTITIDTTAPAQPPAPTLVNADNTGLLTDAVTKVLNPDFSGTGAPASHIIRLYAGDGIVANSMLLGSTTSDPDGNWTVAVLGGLGAGEHAVFAVAYDTAGNPSQSSPLYNIVIDTTAPAAPTSLTLTAASDTGESNSDRVTNAASLQVTGQGAPDGGKIELFEGGQSLGFATISGTSWSHTVTSITENNTHILHAVAYDAAGNASGQSSSLVFTLDTVSPTTASSAPDLDAASDSGVSTTDNISNRVTPTFTGSIPESGRKVELYDQNNVLRGSATSGSGGSWTITTSAGFTADNDYTLTAYWYDQAGNKSVASNTLAIKVDTNAPEMVGDGTRAFDVTQALSITFNEAVYISSGHVNISYGATMMQIGVNDIAFSNDHRTMTLLAANTLNTGTDYTISFPASMADAAGNLYNDGNIVLDTTAPQLVSTVPVSQNEYNGVISLTFNENIQFATGGSIVLFKSSGQNESYTFTSTSPGWSISGNTITFDPIDLGYGTFHLRLDNAIADLVGNVNTTSLLSDLPLVINRPNP